MKRTVLLALMTLLISTLTLPHNRATSTVIDANESHFRVDAQATIPADPSDLSVSGVTSSSISIAWTDNSSNEDGFKIERCSGANCSDFQWLANMPANVNNITDWGLGKNKTFKYRVQAYNLAGNSGYTNVATGTTTR